jgi:hypothetical protein
MINRHRRAARTVAELGLGPLRPMTEIIPEFAKGTGKATDRVASSFQASAQTIPGDLKYTAACSRSSLPRAPSAACTTASPFGPFP